MRKTQFALAALALVASTAAMADGVTVYGRLDAGIAKISGQSAQFGSGNWDTPVIGFKGAEDLGNGMKASFNLETGIDSGAGNLSHGGTVFGVSPSSMFNRAANIGLSGDFGAVTAGLQVSPFIVSALNGVATNNESFYVPMLAMAGQVGVTGYKTSIVGVSATVPTGGFFIPNAVSYATPNIGGFSANVLTQLAGAGSTTSTGQKYSAASASYANGDLSVSAGYSKTNVTYEVTDLIDFGTVNNKSYTLNAAYNMGPARIAGGYISTSPAGGDRLNTYHLGGSYAVAGNTTASLNYARNNATNAQSIINVGLQYTLSKRSYLYGTVSRARNDALALYSTGATGNSTGYAVGVVHNF